MDDAPPFEIAWTDAWFDAGESDPDSWPETYLVHSVGFLVRDDAEVIHLAGEVLPDGQYRAVTHIPRSLVVSCRQLTKGTGNGSLTV